MAEDLKISAGTKEDQYQSLIPQIKALLENETDEIANMANVCAALKEQFNFFWIGFYIIRDYKLVLGPFQGPVACTRIQKGKGVCGTSWERGEILIVPDVDQFPGHIACNSASRSEIVLPLRKSGQIVGVLDIDSAYLNAFDSTDAKYLAEILTFLS